MGLKPKKALIENKLNLIYCRISKFHINKLFNKM